MDTLIKIGASRTLGISAIYIAILLILGVVLAVRVVFVRRQAKIGIGDGKNADLMQRIRCHGNFSEYAPLLIALLVMLPLLGAREWMVHLAGLGAVVGRILHAIGLSQSIGVSFGRMAGMILTFSTLILGSVALIVLALA